MTGEGASLAWHDLIGMIGVGAILFSYFQLQMGRWNPGRPSYALVNLLGAGAILVSLSYAFNLSAFVVEAAWFVISLIGLIRYFLIRK